MGQGKKGEENCKGKCASCSRLFPTKRGYICTSLCKGKKDSFIEHECMNFGEREYVGFEHSCIFVILYFIQCER